KKGIKHCKRWYWNDLELENERYRTQLYEMHLLLNPSEELKNKLTCREELVVLQVEFADMKGQMQELMEEFKKIKIDKQLIFKQKKGIKHCKRWYWNDLELENERYRTQLYEMHLLLNPSEELKNKLTCREELVVLQVEFADMKGQMQELMEEFKKRIKHCKRWYWNDLELENERYRTQLYEMHLLLNPSEELENKLTCREELVVLQVEFADMEGQMQELIEEFKKSKKMLSFGS
nr:hypothetical protein [Tanacetum cinerariifolium]